MASHTPAEICADHSPAARCRTTPDIPSIDVVISNRCDRSAVNTDADHSAIAIRASSTVAATTG
jgi:hypothetical protein